MLPEITGVRIYEAFSILIILLRLYLQRLLLQWMFYSYISIKFERVLCERSRDLDIKVVTIFNTAFLLCDMLMREISLQ